MEKAEVWTVEDFHSGRCGVNQINTPKAAALRQFTHKPDPPEEKYVLPPEVADLPSVLLRQYVLIALHTQYDPKKHTAGSTGSDFMIYCRVHRTPEFMKLLQKLIPQITEAQLPPPPVVFRLNVPMKVLDVIDGEPPVPLIVEDR